MDYYTNLAVMQYERYMNFKAENPELNELAARNSFFSRQYEIHMSHAIAHGIFECSEYNKNHPTNPI